MKSLSLSLVVVMMVVTLSVATAFRIPIVFKLGNCPRPPVKQDFNITRYLGVWWEYQRFPAPFEAGGTCGSANYTLISSNKIRVVNSGIQRINLLFHTIRRLQRAVGEAVVVDPAKPAELKVSFGNMPSRGNKPNYFVVDTDYDNFAVVYSCSKFGLGNIQFAWILTRQQGVAPTNLDTLHRMLSDAGIDTGEFITVDHSDCSPP